MRYYNLVIALAALLLTAAGARAERKYVLGTEIGFAGGAFNQTGTSSFYQTRYTTGVTPFYAAMPKLTLSSTGQHSQLDLSYSFVGQRYEGDMNYNSFGHYADFALDSRLSQRVRMRLDDRFSSAPSYAFTDFSGTASGGGGFNYLFDPLLANRETISNTANLSFEVETGAASFLTFAGSSSYRYYDDPAETNYALSNQLRSEGSFGWSRKTSQRQTLSAKYTFVDNSYAETYGRAQSHSATLRLERELSPTLNLQLEAGPVWVRGLATQEDFLGANVFFNLNKKIRANQFALFYSHRTSDSSGLGSVSDSDSAGFSFSRALARRAILSMNVNGYESRGRLDNPLNYRNLYAFAALSLGLTERWLLGFGGGYWKNWGMETMDLDTVRGFVSLRYAVPELWRGSR